MPKTIALTHFLGKDGYEKKNCAQAVLIAFQEPLQIPDCIVDSFKEHGGGRAPDGICGAAYAAEFVLGMAGIVEEDTNVVQHLNTLAGSAKCKEIKSHKKLSCVGCVEACTDYLSVLIG